MSASTAPTRPPQPLGRDFRLFFVGQTVSNLGASITRFALPLLVFQLSGSAFNLGLAAAVTMAPYLLFGLVIGAWVDRLDRKWLMIVADLSRGVVLAIVPIAAWTGNLSVTVVYAVAFLSSTLQVAYDAAQFSAVPSLVDRRSLVSANGRLQASFATAAVAGPPLAGLLMGFVALELVILADALSGVLSSGALLLIRRSFNPPTGDTATAQRSILGDVREGLTFVWRHPVLRAISIMMAAVNFVISSSTAQIVLFAREHLAATERQTSLFFSAGSAGVVVLALLAGPLRARFTFGVVALGALALCGLATTAMALTTSLWLALGFWAVAGGCATVFNINTASLRQQVVPRNLLGRVITVAQTTAFMAIPLGGFLGGWLIEWTGLVAGVYAGIGLMTALIAVSFYRWSPLGNAEAYLEHAATPASQNAEQPGIAS